MSIIKAGLLDCHSKDEIAQVFLKSNNGAVYTCKKGGF